MKKIFSILLALTIVCSALTAGFVTPAESVYIDNSDVTPKYVEDEFVTLEDSGNGLMSPDWVKTLIIAELQIATATKEGTFEAAIPVLDHYQETGVNAVWLTPIFDDDDNSNYGNFGVHTINTNLTGKTDYAEGWQVFKNFVDEAHKRNIRVILDVVSWGVDDNAPMVTENPDWIDGWTSKWNGYEYNWDSSDFRNYYINQLVWLTTDIGVDGFRCDLEPGQTGSLVYPQVRAKALEQGQKICMFSEMANDRSYGCYDFEEHSPANDQWNNTDLFTETYNIVDTVKTGAGIGTANQQANGTSGNARFYSYIMSCHDSPDGYGIEGSVASVAYQALFSPFIPIFYMGEEFNNEQITDASLYGNYLNLDLLNNSENRAFFEEFKKMIRIRRLNSDIFENFTTSLKDTKMEEVEVAGLETIQGYVRYNDEKAIMVVANNNIHTDPPLTVTVPFKKIDYANNQYEVINLMTDEVVATGNRATLYDFEANVAKDDVGIYLLRKVGSDKGGYSDNLIATPNLTITDYNTHNVLSALDNSKTYMLEFDAVITSNPLYVLLREDVNNANNGQCFSITTTEAKISTDMWGVNTVSVSGALGLTENAYASVKIIMAPTAITVYVNGELVQMSGNDTTTVSAVDTARLSFAAGGGTPNAQIYNISLKEKRAELGDSIIGTQSATVDDYNLRYAAANLSGDKAYMLEFNMVVDANSPTYVLLREGATSKYGQCLAISANELRIGNDMWTNDLVATGTLDLTAGSTANVRVLMEPTRITTIINGKIVKVDEGKNSVAVNAVQYGELAFAAGGDTPNANISDITLKEVYLEKGDINKDGQVNAPDIISLKKFILGVSTESEEYSDVKTDGVVDILDFIALKKLLVS